jgi:hypothetical protein
MKQVLYMYVGLLLLNNSTVAQSVIPPVAVAESFAKRYPHGVVDKWLKSARQYEVLFSLNSRKMKSCFKEDGTWNYSCRLVQYIELPVPVSEAVAKSKYISWQVIQIIEWQGAREPLQYRLTLKNSKEKKEIAIDVSGHFIN